MPSSCMMCVVWSHVMMGHAIMRYDVCRVAHVMLDHAIMLYDVCHVIQCHDGPCHQAV